MELNPKKNIDESLKVWKEYFLKDKKVTGLSQKSLEVYERVLKDFLEFVYLERVNENAPEKIQNINRYFMIAFVDYLNEKKLSPKSKKTYLDIIYSFLLFISYYNDDGIDLLYKHKKVTVKIPKHKIIFFTEKEIKKIKSYIQKEIEKAKSYKKLKNTVAIYLLLHTGARFQEIAYIKKEHIEFGEKEISILLKGKGDKERYTYVKSEFITKYLKETIRLSKHKKYVFTNKNGTDKIPYNTLRDFFKRVCRKLNIAENKANLHILRHSLATHLLKQGVNIKTISNILGHSDINVTVKYYAEVTEEDEKKALIGFFT